MHKIEINKGERMNKILVISWLVGSMIPGFACAGGNRLEPTKTLKIYGKLNPDALLTVEDCSTVKCINDNPEIEGNKSGMKFLTLGTAAFIAALRESLDAKKDVNKDEKSELIIRSRVLKFEGYSAGNIGLAPGYNIIGNSRWKETFEIAALDAKTEKVVFGFSETAMPANKKSCAAAGAAAGNEILGVLSGDLKEAESDHWPDEK
jgi:hypothetical protein